jgi:hypothetical protein
MVNCSLKLVNASYDNKNNLYKVKYIPFSISTIKLAIQNEEHLDVDILIKPTRFQNNEDFCGGFDDEKRGLRIIWGGGQENGLQTIVKGNDKKYLFLFVFPMDNFKLLDYNLTLQVNKTILESNQSNMMEEIIIELSPIQNVQLIENIAHQKIRNNSETTKITFVGNLVGSYYPRWYPELFNLIANTDNYYQLDSTISNISFNLFKKSQGSNKDRIILNFNENEIAIVEGDMDGANYHIDLFKFNNAFIIRIWFLWISKKQFRDKNNLEPLQRDVQTRGIFDNPELPDFERFDIIVSSLNGNILAVCTDFHWQEYWYKLRNDSTHMIGVVAKLFHPINESLSRLCNRNFVDNNYENIITDLTKIVSLSENFDLNPNLMYLQGEEIEESIHNREKMPVPRGKNFFRSHVPYVRNGNILSNMISHIVDES